MKNKILLYASTTSLVGDDLKETTVVTSPVVCLDQATEKEYDLIVIMFDLGFLKERKAIVELCAALRRNHHTIHVPLLCVLPSKHRNLLEHLNDAKVKYVIILDPKDRIRQSQLQTFTSSPSQKYEINRILSEVCPHIHYFPISRDKEILYCGAYRSRLVLGTYRLKQYCENKNHINCEYFQNST